MPDDAYLGRAIGELVALPFVLLRDLFRFALWLSRLRQRWRAVPLQDKNRVRAVCGLAGLVACAVFAAHGYPVIGERLTAVIAGFALLYLVVGLRSRSATVDVMALFWRCVLILSSLAVLVHAKTVGFSCLSILPPIFCGW